MKSLSDFRQYCWFLKQIQGTPIFVKSGKNGWNCRISLNLQIFHISSQHSNILPTFGTICHHSVTFTTIWFHSPPFGITHYHLIPFFTFGHNSVPFSTIWPHMVPLDAIRYHFAPFLTIWCCLVFQNIEHPVRPVCSLQGKRDNFVPTWIIRTWADCNM